MGLKLLFFQYDNVLKTTHWLKYKNFLRIETIHDDLVNLNLDQLFGHDKQ